MRASCIIPVYNAEKTIRKCVESIIYGKERDVEVILVDDCSHDGSWELCRELSEAHDNIRAIQNPENRGVSHTRNRGLEAAQGEYILFVDSDDWVSGDYVKKMCAMAEKYPAMLAIAGFAYCDQLSGVETKYVYSEEEQESLVRKEDFCRLVDATLIQSSCNKIYRRDVVEANRLRFDETQSMGEDFRFVLDYMRSIRCEGCAVLNVPLYYYVRQNTTSLMSKFGISDFAASEDRLRQLAALGNAGAAVLDDQVEKMKRNYIYHIARYRGFSREEKVKQIELLTQDGKAARHYAYQKKVMLAERVVQTRWKITAFGRRVRGKWKRELRDKKVRSMRSQMTGRDFTIISQNCIGGVFYHDMGMEFLSPTINLYLTAADFSRFVDRLQEYMAMELEMEWLEKYPIGHLGDVTIHFQHYASCTEAKAVWERRKARIRWDRILVLSTDHEGFDGEMYRRWQKIPYPKVLFTAQKEFAGGENVVYFQKYSGCPCVPDLIPEREFYQDGTLIRAANMFR